MTTLAEMLGMIAGTAAVVGGLSWWLGRTWAERRNEAERARQALELEELRARLAEERERSRAELELERDRYRVQLDGQDRNP